MWLSKTKRQQENEDPQRSSSSASSNSGNDLGYFLSRRDYTGAIALLEYEEEFLGKKDVRSKLWKAYCLFHNGNLEGAKEIYEKLLKETNADVSIHLYLAIILFYQGDYEKADEEALKGPKNSLQTRILFHTAHKLDDEKRMMEYHEKLEDTPEDQLCLASVHYLRGHYQEAIDIFKRLLSQDKDNLATCVYAGMCYYKLERYDVSNEILSTYLVKYPNSCCALNLKASNDYQLSGAKAAEKELKKLSQISSPFFSYMKELRQHNEIVFRDGADGELQVFQNLVDDIPEARINLAIYHLKNSNYDDACRLFTEHQPETSLEYTLKGFCHAGRWQVSGDQNDLQAAQECFKSVGSDEVDRDTILGRQSMVSLFFLEVRYEDCLTYLNSVKEYCDNDDAFNMNYAQVLMKLGEWKEVEDCLLKVQDDNIRESLQYKDLITRCHILQEKPETSWTVYKSMESSNESFQLLKSLAAEFFRNKHHIYAAKAYDELCELEPTDEHWQGKVASCIGAFKDVVENQDHYEDYDSLSEILTIIRKKPLGIESDKVVQAIRGWMRKREFQ